MIKLIKYNIFLIILAILAAINIQAYQFNKITILTAPVTQKRNHSYGGHKAVTKSIIEGLKNIKINFNYNPSLEKDIGDVVIVLANIPALKQAITLKKQGKIKKLLAGPNLMVRANEHNRILASKEIDICIVPSYWVQIAYEKDAPSLKGRIRTWPAGVNAKFWNIAHKDKRKDNKNVLVYIKKASGASLCKPVKDILKNYGWHPIILKYGSYNLNKYKKALSQCRFSVFLSRSESQGIALAEAWAMDIPTLVWNQGYLKAHGTFYDVCSACPYLNDQLGKDWKNLDELEKLISNIEKKLPNFSPRKWVLENMTYEARAKLMLEIINSL